MKKAIHVFCLISVLFYTTVLPSRAYAQALPAGQFAIAVGKTIMTKMKFKGFAANDPKYGATIRAASMTLTDVAVTAASTGGSIVLGAVGAPVWLALLGSVAIGYGVKIGLDYFMPNLPVPAPDVSKNIELQPPTNSVFPSVSYEKKTSVPNPDKTIQPIIFPDEAWYGGDDRTVGVDGFFNYINSAPQYEINYTATSIVDSGPIDYFTNGNLITAYKNVSWTQQYCQGGIDIKPACTGEKYTQVTRFGRHAGYCPPGYSFSGEGCSPPSFIEQTQTKTGTVQDIANNIVPLGDDVKYGPINPEIIAKVANEAWQRAAAQEGYSGVPYDMADPITQSDVATAYSPENNPTGDLYPTVQDGLNPISTPGTTIVINVDPYNQSSTNPSYPSYPPASSGNIDLGPNPSIPEPVLETTPTAEEILAPLLSLFPSFKTFVVPSHGADCPRPSIDLFEKHLVLDGHCALLEQVRPTLYAVMAFVWIAIGLFIILAA